MKAISTMPSRMPMPATVMSDAFMTRLMRSYRRAPTFWLTKVMAAW